MLVTLKKQNDRKKDSDRENEKRRRDTTAVK